MRNSKIRLNLIRDVDAIEETILFANLQGDDEIVRHAERPFATQDGMRLFVGFDREKGLRNRKRLQAEVRAWLECIIDSAPAGKRRQVAEQINEQLKQHFILVDFSLMDGRLSSVLKLAETQSLFAVAYGAALLFDEASGYRKHLGQCQLASCSRFFVHFGNGAKKYCSQEHSFQMRKQKFRSKALGYRSAK